MSAIRIIGLTTDTGIHWVAVRNSHGTKQISFGEETFSSVGEANDWALRKYGADSEAYALRAAWLMIVNVAFR